MVAAAVASSPVAAATMKDGGSVKFTPHKIFRKTKGGTVLAKKAWKRKRGEKPRPTGAFLFCFGRKPRRGGLEGVHTWKLSMLMVRASGGGSIVQGVTF